MKIVLSKSNFVIFLLILIYLIMWLPMQDVPVVSSMDEILAFILLPLLVLKLKVNRENRIFIYSILIFLLVGLVSSILSDVTQPMLAKILDFISFIKLPIVFLYFRYIFSDSYARKFISSLLSLSKLLVSISFVFAIANLFIDFGMSYDFRYGLRSFEFFYHNPGTFVALMTVCFAIINLESRKNFVYKLLIIINLLLTLRTVAFGIVVLILFLPYLLMNQLKIRSILLILPMIVIAGYGAIENYFIGQVTPRSLLLKNSLIVAQRYFPMGAGFGTYGSNAAKVYYSPLYYEFNFNYVWGLSPQFGHILNDNFWPMIVAQFGVIGLTFYMVFLGAMTKDLFSRNMNKDWVISGTTLISFLLLSSMGANVITGVLGVLIIIPYTLILKKSEWSQNE